MKLELYLDVFILENTILNLLVILLTSKISAYKPGLKRSIIGALSGTIFAVCIVYFDRDLLQSFVVKISVSALLILIIYFPAKPFELAKLFVIFCFCAMIVAGTMFFVLNLGESNLELNNGILVVESGMKPMVLAITILLSTIFVKVLYRIRKNNSVKEKLLVPLSIIIGNKIIYLPALIDTGNLLCDPISNTPVIVAEFIAVKDILPPEVSKLFESGNIIDINSFSTALTSESWVKRLRVIPFCSLGNQKDVLIGFKPDMVEIGDEKRKISNVIVGIYRQKLSKNKEFQALLGPQLI